MAITMSDARIETDERSSLKGAEINSNVLGEGVSFNYGDGFGNREATGATLAGVTQSFGEHLQKTMLAYRKSVDDILNELQYVVSTKAFQGAGVQGALEKFVTSVREVAKSYMLKLTIAENQILSSVQKAYATQDSDLNQSMSGDATTLDNEQQKANGRLE